MPTWETLDCLGKSVNQGYGKCPIDLGALTYELAVPKGTFITEAQLLDFEATLREKTNEDDPNQRWYLLGPFPQFAQNNTTPGPQTASSGLTRTVSIGFFGWTLTQWAGGWCAEKNLIKFHDSQDRFDFLNVHAASSGGSIIMGVLTTNNTGEQGMKGISMSQVFTTLWTMGDGNANGTSYSIEFKVGDSSQMRENASFLPVSFDISSTAFRLIDVELKGATASGSPAGDFNVTAVTGCGGEDLATYYGTELAAIAAWTAVNASTGGNITITSVTLVNGKFHILLDTTDTDYPTAGGKILLNLVGVSALAALDVIGYESAGATPVIAD